MRALYDVNLLLALFDEEHTLHNRASAFHLKQEPFGWATCAITENGFLRIISQPSYTNPIPILPATERLREAKSAPYTYYFSCDLSVSDASHFNIERVLGPKMLTDVYLLALAVANQARFVTFDRRISIEAVIGAKPEHLVVL